MELAPQETQAIALAYVQWIETLGHGPQDAAPPKVALGKTLLASRAPQGRAQTTTVATAFLGPIMAGMMILFVFFTGSAAAQSIIQEDEEGTLARLFTTPTPQGVILRGKFLAVAAMLVIQILVLLLASALLFRIRWGNPLSLLAMTFGLVVAASGMGVLLMSFVKSSRQAGPVLGIVIMLTGLLGGLIPTGDPTQPSRFAGLSLALPQGWAMRGWRLTLAGASPDQIMLPFVVLVVVGIVFLAAGTAVLRKRFA